MTQSQFSVSWDEHLQNICSGLSSLQQNGELVDMTLAADGCLVKVHQVIIALSSPFLKDLIIAAQCPHPVIVLNKVSHNTLAAILEYIYTGEVLVAVEDLNELIDAAKELHIKGLQEMNLSQALSSEMQHSPVVLSAQLTPSGLEGEDDLRFFEISNVPENTNIDIEKEGLISIKEVTPEVCKEDNEVISDKLPSTIKSPSPTLEEHTSLGLVQYTVSNQGSLQLILNRYIYYLKHTNRDNSRQWRCVDYLNNQKCPAYVVTLDNVVLQRTSAHSHAFHDKKILKKLESGAIFTTIKDAENEGTIKKNNRQNEDCESE